MISTEVKNLSYLRDPDVQLMLRFRKGDEDAFTQLVTLYQDRLVNLFSTHLRHDHETAEDLAQEVFMRIHRARERYEPRAKFSTWLFRIANNLASNSRRTKGRRKEVPLPPGKSGPMGTHSQEDIAVEKSGLMPTRQVDKIEMRAVVQSAMDSLSERQKMAVFLHKFEQMSYADIGATMDLTPTAVKSLLSRARDNLRIKLEPYMK